MCKNYFNRLKLTNNNFMKMDNQQQNCNLIYNGRTIKKEHLQELYDKYNNGMSLMELSKNYNYNIATIRAFLIKNNVKIRNVKESVKKFHKQNTIKIDQEFEENILGWILGDGGLRLQKHAINPYFTYTDKHEEYIHYVGNFLTKYNIKYNITFRKQTGCYQLQSETRPEFHKYYNLFYGYEGLNECGQKRKILPNVQLTPTILKNWYIGDGSSSKMKNSYNHRGSISCKYINDFIINQLNDICGVKISSYKVYNKRTTTCYTYRFNNKLLKKLLLYIGLCPVECYKYKWITRCSTTIIETSDNR